MQTHFLLRLTLSLWIFLQVSFLGFSLENSWHWKISGNGLTKDSYLFGTIHLICKEDFVMKDRVKNAFERSDKVVMELDLSDTQLLADMQQYSLNPGMKNIISGLSEEDAKILDAFFTENFGAGIAQIGILKTIVLSSMALIKTLPCAETESFENYFTDQSKALNKAIKELETVKIQLAYLPIQN